MKTPHRWTHLDIEINDAPAFTYPRPPFRFVLHRRRPSGVDWVTKLELNLPGATSGDEWLWVPGYNGGPFRNLELVLPHALRHFENHDGVRGAMQAALAQHLHRLTPSPSWLVELVLKSGPDRTRVFTETSSSRLATLLSTPISADTIS